MLVDKFVYEMAKGKKLHLVLEDKGAHRVEEGTTEHLVVEDKTEHSVGVDMTQERSMFVRNSLSVPLQLRLVISLHRLEP